MNEGYWALLLCIFKNDISVDQAVKKIYGMSPIVIQKRYEKINQCAV